jgi:hypothetical protein
LKPDFAEAYLEDGALLVALKRNEEAKTLYNQALERIPTDSPYHSKITKELEKLK